jgi:hypothetical protein
MDKLTVFQIQCETKLHEALQEHGVELVNRRIDGENETYITADIPSENIRVYIYTDEPELCIEDSSYIFEVPDYRDTEVRISKFIDAVLSVLQGNLPHDVGSSRIVLSKGKKL